MNLAKTFLIAPSKFQVMGGVGILSLLINLPVFWFINNRDLNCNDQLRLILITIPTLVMRLIIPMLALTIFSCLTVRKVYFLTLLGLGLIKINDVSANFNNPRPSLILNN